MGGDTPSGGYCIVQQAGKNQPEVRLHYVERGAGPDRPLVVLLHGFPEFCYAWRDYLPMLAAAGFHAVAPDLRGYHLSDKPAGVRHFAVPYLVQDILKLVHHFSQSQAAVVGHDWGGVIAWELAEHHPELVSSLVIMNAPHRGAFARNLRRNLLFAIRQTVRSWYVFAFQLPYLPELGLRANEFRFVERAFRGWAIRPDTFSDEDIRRYKKALATPGALRSAVNYYRALFRSSFGRSILAGVLGFNKPAPLPMPTLLVWGLNDKALDRAIINGVEDFISGPFERLEIPNCSHWVHLEHPDLVGKRVVEFLRRYQPPFSPL